MFASALHFTHATVGWLQIVAAPVVAAAGAWALRKVRQFGRLLDSIDKSVNNKQPHEPTLRAMVETNAKETNRLALAQEQIQADLAANTAETKQATALARQSISMQREHRAFHAGTESTKR